MDTTLKLVNAGTITGLDVAAIDAGDLADRVENSGQIVGEVRLDGGADTVLNSGDIAGDVDLGSGDDVFLGGNGAVTGTIVGGQGFDLIVASQGLDEVYGGTETDFIYGNGGEDRLYGDGSADGVLGGQGDDLIYGGDGDGLLFGGDGIDLLYGGAGRDILYGDTGSDFFTFEDTTDSAVGGNRDVVVDYEVGVDFIDFFAIAEAAFVGSAAFSGTGGAEIRVTTFAGVSSLVRLDADGNGTTDLEVLLLNASGLTAADFGV